MARGQLRIYLGAAPGVGKTYEMLLEGHRRLQQGVDCVIGFVEPHGRRAIQALVPGLELVPRRQVPYRGGVLEEMDIDGVLARHPQLVLVDELAHTNAPGSRNPKRWQDVGELLDAGIDVLTTLNVQHLESLGDVLTAMTGVQQRETVPDEVARRADELELVDLSPEALRRRMVAGDIYPPDRVDAALSHYFRPGNLSGLRELALLWMADRVDEGLQRYRGEHGITASWEARERIVVGVSGGPESDALIRRAARLAARTPGSDLMAVYVARSDGRPGADRATLDKLCNLVEELGGSWHQVVGADVSNALGQFARHENATQLIIGASRRTPWWRALTGREVVAHRVSGLTTALDVHVVTDEKPARFAMRLPPLRGVSPQRRAQALGLIAVLLPAVTIALALLRSRLNLSSDLLVYLLVTVLIAVVGGWYPALAAALIAVMAADYFLVEPVYSFRIAIANDAVALGVFLAIAVAVSWVVEVSARNRRLAERSSAEAAVLTSMAGALLRGEDKLPQLLELVRETFGLEALSLLECPDSAAPLARKWMVTASCGDRPPERPDQGTVQALLDRSSMLCGRGPALAPADAEIFTACAAQISEMLRQRRLTERSTFAEHETESERARTTLMAAAARTLTGDVASVKCGVAALRAALSEAGDIERIDAIEQAVNRIAVSAQQLEDLARARAGALDARIRQVDVADVVAAALEELGPGRHAVNVTMPEDLPDVVSDAAVLVRVVTALAAHVIRLGSAQRVPTIAAVLCDSQVEIRFQADPAPSGSASRPVSGDSGFTVEAARQLLAEIDGSLRTETGRDGSFVLIVGLPAAARRP